MIDDYHRTMTLVEEMEAELPIPVRPTSALVRMLRQHEVKISRDRELEIKRVFYMGNEGGISCDVTPPGMEKTPIICSLTHLRVSARHPLAEEIRVYQRERASKLKAYITYVAPSGKKMNQPIVKTTTFFGKAMSCDFNCTGFFIYPKHALIVRDNNGFRLVNLAPHRMTRLNQKVVDDERMQNGDKFFIGRNLFEFFVGIPPSDRVRG